MTLGDKLPGGCLPQSLRCGVTEGVFSDTLEIVEGEAVNSVLGKIVGAVECLKEDECDPCNSCGETTTTTTTESAPTNLGNLQSTGNQSKRLTTPFNLSIVPTGNAVRVEYNMSDVVSENACERTSNRISVSSGGNQINSSSALVGSFSATADKFPLQYTVMVSCSKDGQTQELTFNKTVSASAASTQEYLTCTTIGSGTGLSSQGDVNEYLDTCVNEIKGRVTALETINYAGNTGIESIAGNLETQIAAVQTNIDNFDGSCDGVSICDLKTEVDAINAKLSVMAGEIASLDSKYASVFALINK